MGDEIHKQTLITRLRAGESFKYIFFWGHRPEADGSVSKACLSQWWPAPFVVDGERYESAEHWMMAAKARLFGDEAMFRRILTAASPGEAKSLGRQVRGYDDSRWQAQRYELVVQGNRHKFMQQPELADWLKQTVRRVLVEASPVDPIWGIGLAADHSDAAEPERWPGLNLLGFALMDVRAGIGDWV